MTNKNIKTIIKSIILIGAIAILTSIPTFSQDTNTQPIQEPKIIGVYTESNENFYVEEGDVITEYEDGSYSINDEIQPTNDIANTDTISTYNNITITNVQDDGIATVIINNKEYTFDEAYEWSIGDKAKVTIDNITNKIIGVNPFVTEREINKLSSNGTTYTDQLTTDAELKIYATQWLKDNYNLNLDIPIQFNEIYNPDTNFTINGFITTTIADNKPVQIVIDSNLVNNNDTIKIEITLIHELTHLALLEQGKDFKDKTKTFETEVIKNGSTSNDGTKGVLHSHVTINQNI